MTTWTSDETDRIGSAGGLRISSARADGTLRPYGAIRVVCVVDDAPAASATTVRPALS